ncbi:hypothetical protein HY967_00335 [Candidatus Jorgensenbacteria bacterium]|nr:hypothetical protein [Candidatus Jorgensenbacteria bacterium]
MTFIRKHFKRIARSVIPLIFIASSFPLPANAILGAILGPAAVALLVYAILYILQYIGAIFFSLAGYLTGFFLTFNYNILDSTNTLIRTGWNISRDIANLGFVLVIVIIALATILRFREYGAKKLLPKLIAAAILVNFSLTIAGVFIDFSHVLTRQFFGAIAGSQNVVDLVQSLSGAFDAQKLFTEPAEPPPIDPDEEAGALESFAVSTLIDIAALAFTVIFTFIAAFVLIFFAFMLLIRYLYLTALLILAPIVWLFWVFPVLAGQFHKWWSKFLEWVFFAPVVSFFFYLSLLSVRAMANDTSLAVPPHEFFKAGAIQALMTQGAKMVVLIGFLFAGLIMAQKMGIIGSTMAMDLATKAGRGARSWMGKKAVEGVRGVGRRAATAGAGKDLEGKSYLQRLGETQAARIPLIGRALTGLAGVASRTKDKMREEAEAKTKGVTPETAGASANRLLQATDTPEALTNAQQIVADFLNALKDPDTWNGLTQAQRTSIRERAVSAARKTNSIEKVATADVELASQPGVLSDSQFLKLYPDIQKAPTWSTTPDETREGVHRRAAQATVGAPDNNPNIMSTFVKLRENLEAWESLPPAIQNQLTNKVAGREVIRTSNRDLRVQAAAADLKLFNVMGFDPNDDGDIREILSRVKDISRIDIRDPRTIPATERDTQMRIAQNFSFGQVNKYGADASTPDKANLRETLKIGIGPTFDELHNLNKMIADTEKDIEKFAKAGETTKVKNLSKSLEKDRGDLKTAIQALTPQQKKSWDLHKYTLENTTFADLPSEPYNIP